MGIQQDIKESIKAFHDTKIGGQQTDEDLKWLESELSEIAATISTTNVGGSHVHVEIITKWESYTAFLNENAKFITPINPGAYPTLVNLDLATHERQVVEDKASVCEFETYLSVENALCIKIKDRSTPND